MSRHQFLFTHSRTRRALTMILLVPILSASAAAQKDPWSFESDLIEVRSIDGSGNSIGGATHTPLRRVAPAAYPDDGSGTTIIEFPIRENPRTISNRIASQGPVSIPNLLQFSDNLWAWGQFLDHDIDLTEASAANGTANIPVLPGDPLGPNPILFSRSNFDASTGTAGNPRQQVNEITAFIDASNVYGSDEVRAAALREFTGGRLKTSDGGLLPFNLDGLPNAGGPSPALFLAGDVRANENVMLTSLHTLFVREHNRLAALLQLLAPEATDEEIYQWARKIVGAQMQLVTYGEFLPALLGPATPSVESLAYNSSVDPTIANEFSTAFYRFGHSLLSPQLVLSEFGQTPAELPLRDAFFQPQFLADDPHNVDRLLRGACLQLSQNVDNKVVDDVRNFLFGPPGAGGLDLASLNIQRGRDHGLPDYNTLRAAYGLAAYTDVSEIVDDAAVQQALTDMYGGVNNVDAWVGGLAEEHLPGSAVGKLLSVSLSEQFSRLMRGDRLSIVNDLDLDSPIVKAAIHLPEVTLANIIRANTTVSALPEDVFFVGDHLDSDVIATYDELENRIHITGNSQANNVLMFQTPFGIVLTGFDATLINGETSTVIATDLRPHVTCDLGGVNDVLTVLFCTFGDFVTQMGDGDDDVTGFFSRASRLAIDGGDGTDEYNGGIRVPRKQSRIHNLP